MCCLSATAVGGINSIDIFLANRIFVTLLIPRGDGPIVQQYNKPCSNVNVLGAISGELYRDQGKHHHPHNVYHVVFLRIKFKAEAVSNLCICIEHG